MNSECGSGRAEQRSSHNYSAGADAFEEGHFLSQGDVLDSFAVQNNWAEDELSVINWELMGGLRLSYSQRRDYSLRPRVSTGQGAGFCL